MAEVVSAEGGQGAVELVADDDEEGYGGAEAVDHHAEGGEAPAPRAARRLHRVLKSAGEILRGKKVLPFSGKLNVANFHLVCAVREYEQRPQYEHHEHPLDGGARCHPPGVGEGAGEVEEAGAKGGVHDQEDGQHQAGALLLLLLLLLLLPPILRRGKSR